MPVTISPDSDSRDRNGDCSSNEMIRDTHRYLNLYGILIDRIFRDALNFNVLNLILHKEKVISWTTPDVFDP